MLRKSITYVNFSGEKKSKDVYFNLTKLEAHNMNKKFEGGLLGELEKVFDARDSSGILDLLSFLVLESYGERSEDGDIFMKSEEIKSKFKCSSIYETLMDEFIAKPSEIGDFMLEVIPGREKKVVTDEDRIEELKARLKELESKANA